MEISQNILVSVSMIAYNREDYISVAIEGVLFQKTNFDIELIIGEDCSTDRTREICLEYKRKYPDKIKLILQKSNLGLMRNSISTILACEGKYIATCDADDYWIDPYKLQKQVDFLENNENYVACFHNVRVFDENTGNVTLFNSLKEVVNPTTEDILTRQWFIASSSLLFRNIIRFDDGALTLTNNDYLFDLLLAKEGLFYYLHDVMSVYRVHNNTFSFNMNKNKVRLYEKIIELYAYVKPLYDEKYFSLIDKQISFYTLEKEKHIRLSKYPFLAYLDWRYYKRKIYNSLRIQRVSK